MHTAALRSSSHSSPSLVKNMPNKHASFTRNMLIKDASLLRNMLNKMAAVTLELKKRDMQTESVYIARAAVTLKLFSFHVAAVRACLFV